MALVDIDSGLKKRIEKAIAENPIAYPTIKNFCDKAIKLALEKIDKKR